MAEANFCSTFLQNIGLSVYISKFLSQGFDTLIDLALLDSKDLDLVNIDDQEHRKTILEAVDEISALDWMSMYNLESYNIGLQQQNIQTIKDLKQANINDSFLDKLNIKSPGHRKRFCICLQLLQRKHPESRAEQQEVREEQLVKRRHEPLVIQTEETEALEIQKETRQIQERVEDERLQKLEEQNKSIRLKEDDTRLQNAAQELQEDALRHEVIIPTNLHPDTVALGYWSKPSTLPRLSHDFLCVRGYLKATPEDLNQSDCLEFLLDSASDVVTAREQVIRDTGLEYLKTVESHGVHSIEYKPLYKGFIRLGKSDWIQVEVQPEEYESVGSTVLQKFYHFINGNFHQWIPNLNPVQTRTQIEAS